MLVLCTLIPSPDLAQNFLAHIQELDQSIEQSPDRYNLQQFERSPDYLAHIEAKRATIDCLILEATTDLPALLKHLKQRTILLPTVILDPNASDTPPPTDFPENLDPPTEKKIYHDAVVRLPTRQLAQLDRYIEDAIAKFLRLSSPPPLDTETPNTSILHLTALSSLSQQQRRLADKLKERLGYLGVYYKRNPAHFLRHMNPQERKEILLQLKEDYRQIILSYFSSRATDTLNQAIDTFVDLAFLSDISVSQIVELHIELMDEYSKQLKLEGRSDDILQDYRLTLIDVIAHLCEMYRRSIPRES